MKRRSNWAADSYSSTRISWGPRTRPSPRFDGYTIVRSSVHRNTSRCGATLSARKGWPHPKGETTMRFMMLMMPKGYEQAAPGTMPDPKAVAAMMKYNETLQKAGVLLALDGLHPPSAGVRVSFQGGKAKVSDGPFAEAKEVVGGYWMIQVKSKEEAIEWASRCPASDNEVIEIRQVQEMSEFPPEIQSAAKLA